MYDYAVLHLYCSLALLTVNCHMPCASTEGQKILNNAVKYLCTKKTSYSHYWYPDSLSVQYSHYWYPDSLSVQYSHYWYPDSLSVQYSHYWYSDSLSVQHSHYWYPNSLSVQNSAADCRPLHHLHATYPLPVQLHALPPPNCSVSHKYCSAVWTSSGSTLQCVLCPDEQWEPLSTPATTTNYYELISFVSALWCVLLICIWQQTKCIPQLLPRQYTLVILMNFNIVK